MVDEDAPHPWLQQEFVCLQEAHTLSTQLTMEVLWSNLHFYHALAHCIALLLLPDEDSRDAGCEHIRRLTEAVLKAEAFCRTKAACGEVRDLLADLSWHVEPLTRVLMRSLVEVGFDGQDPGLQKLARRMYAGTASSKDTLESCFNWMQRQIQYMNTNAKARDSMKYLLASLNPYCGTAGAPKILPSQADWWLCWQSDGGRKAVAQQAPSFYNVNSTPLPRVPNTDPEGQDATTKFPTPAQLATVAWRAAGGPATQRSAAAAAYLMHDADNEWENLSKCWAGFSSSKVESTQNCSDSQPLLSPLLSRLILIASRAKAACSKQARSTTTSNRTSTTWRWAFANIAPWLCRWRARIWETMVWCLDGNFMYEITG